MEWATCLVRDGKEEIYVPFPTAVRFKLDPRFRIEQFIVETDEDGQWYVGIEATRIYDGEPYNWTAVDMTFHLAQVNLLRWISGWWFEDDRY